MGSRAITGENDDTPDMAAQPSLPRKPARECQTYVGSLAMPVTTESDTTFKGSFSDVNEPLVPLRSRFVDNLEVVKARPYAFLERNLPFLPK